MFKPQLSERQKRLIKCMKDEWKEKISWYGRIYSERRKTFYRIKMYVVPERSIKLVEKIANRYKLGEVTIDSTSYYYGREKRRKDFIIKIPYDII